MRGPAAVPPLMAVVAVLIAAGCSSDHAAGAKDRPTSEATPTPGGPTPERHRAPRRDMDRLERLVAAQLARQIAPQGLTLAYLDCPHWDGAVPSRLTCRGYVDGLVADVRVLLKAAVEGRAVSYDARLGSGVIATHNLV